MTPIELAEKAFKVFNLQDTKEAPVIDLPIYYGKVLLASIRLKHTNGSWKGELADWEVRDIVDCFEHPDKYGIKNVPTEQVNRMDAYELANDIENGQFNDTNYDKKKTAEFIRHMADEIKKLQDQFDKAIDFLARANNMTKRN